MDSHLTWEAFDTQNPGGPSQKCECSPAFHAWLVVWPTTFRLHDVYWTQGNCCSLVYRVYPWPWGVAFGLTNHWEGLMWIQYSILSRSFVLLCDLRVVIFCRCTVVGIANTSSLLIPLVSLCKVGLCRSASGSSNPNSPSSSCSWCIRTRVRSSWSTLNWVFVRCSSTSPRVILRIRCLSSDLASCCEVIVPWPFALIVNVRDGSDAGKELRPFFLFDFVVVIVRALVVMICSEICWPILCVVLPYC